MSLVFVCLAHLNTAERSGARKGGSTVCMHVSSCYTIRILCESRLRCEHDCSLRSECFDCVTVLVLRFTADVRDLMGL